MKKERSVFSTIVSLRSVTRKVCKQKPRSYLRDLGTYATCDIHWGRQKDFEECLGKEKKNIYSEIYVAFPGGEVGTGISLMVSLINTMPSLSSAHDSQNILTYNNQ